MVNAAVPIVLLPLLSEALGAAEYGVLGIIESAILLLNQILIFGLGGVLSVEIFQTSRARFAKLMAGAVCLTLACAAASFFAAAAFFGLRATPTVSPLILAVVVVGATTTALVRLIATIAQADRALPAYIGVMGGSIAFGLLLTLAALGLGANTWHARIIPTIVGQVFALSIGGVWLARASLLKFHRKMLVVLQPHLTLSLPILPHVFAAQWMMSADRFMVLHFHGEAATGSYTATATIALAMSLVQNVVTQAWGPHLYRTLSRGSDDERRAIPVLMAGVMAALVVFAALWMAVGPAVGRLLVRGDLRVEGDIFFFLTAAYCLLGLYRVLGMFLWYQKRTRTIMVISVSGAGLVTVLSWIGASATGPSGAAAATFFGYLALFVVGGWWSLRASRHLLPGVSR